MSDILRNYVSGNLGEIVPARCRSRGHELIPVPPERLHSLPISSGWRWLPTSPRFKGTSRAGVGPGCACWDLLPHHASWDRVSSGRKARRLRTFRLVNRRRRTYRGLMNAVSDPTELLAWWSRLWREMYARAIPFPSLAPQALTQPILPGWLVGNNINVTEEIPAPRRRSAKLSLSTAMGASSAASSTCSVI